MWQMVHKYAFYYKTVGTKNYVGGNIMRLAEVENGAQQDVIAAGSSALPEAIAKDLANKGARMVRKYVTFSWCHLIKDPFHRYFAKW